MAVEGERELVERAAGGASAHVDDEEEVIEGDGDDDEEGERVVHADVGEAEGVAVGQQRRVDDERQQSQLAEDKHDGEGVG